MIAAPHHRSATWTVDHAGAIQREAIPASVMSACISEYNKFALVGTWSRYHLSWRRSLSELLDVGIKQAETLQEIYATSQAHCHVTTRQCAPRKSCRAWHLRSASAVGHTITCMGRDVLERRGSAWMQSQCCELDSMVRVEHWQFGMLEPRQIDLPLLLCPGQESPTAAQQGIYH